MSAGRIGSLSTAVVAAIVVASCAGGPPSASIVPTPTPGPSGPRPLEMGALAAGEWQTNRFEPTLVFTLPKGWQQFFPDDPDEVYLGGPRVELAISRPAQVADPATGEPVATPESLSEWFAAHPAFGFPDPVAVQVASRPSSAFDLPATTEDVDLFPFPTGAFHTAAGVPLRIYIVPLDGLDIVVTVSPPFSGGTIEDAIEAALPVVESLGFAE